jgi:hypothetical protein
LWRFARAFIVRAGNAIEERCRGGMMKTRILTGSLALPVILLAGFCFSASAASSPVDPCALLTKADVEALVNETVSDGQIEKTSTPQGASCKYSYKKKGAAYGVKVKVSATDALKQEGFFSSAKDVFARQKKARMASEDTAKKVKVIPALGDDAFWNGFDLWILKGDYCINIAAHSYLAGTFKNSEAMEKARYDQDLAFSQKVAGKVLPRIR